MLEWEPGASAKTMRTRGDTLAKIRQFFAARNVLEVETPLLAHATATDVYIQSWHVEQPARKIEDRLYLQTSPEFSMKRLLGTGVGPIYQICKAFRKEEASPQHNPEFTMLEWYRPGYSMFDLMDEVEQLVVSLLPGDAIPRFAYRDLFVDHLGIDPHRVTIEEISHLANSKMDLGSDDLSKTDYLQLLLDKCIEPLLPDKCFVYDYPVDQAALAAIEKDGQEQSVARRFELYCGGMEIANGYFELVDADEQRARFDRDLGKRKELGLEQYPVDERLLAALQSGLPACAGVALGIDRLVMQLTGANSIDQVITFTTDHA